MSDWPQSGNKLLLRDTAEATVGPSSTAEATLKTVSIPGGILGTDKRIFIELVLRFLNNSGSGRTLTLNAKYGGTTFGTCTTGSASSQAASRVGFLSGVIAANGATNDQSGSFLVQGTDSQNSIGGRAAIDSTVAQDLVITGTLSFSHASVQAWTELLIVEYE